MKYGNKKFDELFKHVVYKFFTFSNTIIHLLKNHQRHIVKVFVYNDIPFGVLPPSCILKHQGIGVVINATAKIGKNVIIYQNVTIGGAPIVEDNVKIHPNACIFGDIVIGHDSVIGAGATVHKDVPPYSLVVGDCKIYKDKYK